jgi:hypothetical protein
MKKNGNLNGNPGMQKRMEIKGWVGRRKRMEIEVWVKEWKCIYPDNVGIIEWKSHCTNLLTSLLVDNGMHHEYRRVCLVGTTP